MKITPKKTLWTRIRGFLYRHHIMFILFTILILTIIFFICFVNLFKNVDSLVIVTIALGVITAFQVYYTQKTTWLHALIDVQNEYASKEMSDALQCLYTFYREGCQENEEKLVQEYKRQERGKPKLNQSRRLVTHFYLHLSDIQTNRILPNRIIYSHWLTTDLDILPKIVVPLYVAKAENNDIADELKRRGISEIDKLKKLYNKAYIWNGFRPPCFWYDETH